jgi:hypothetical protein
VTDVTFTISVGPIPNGEPRRAFSDPRRDSEGAGKSGEQRQFLQPLRPSFFFNYRIRVKIVEMSAEVVCPKSNTSAKALLHPEQTDPQGGCAPYASKSRSTIETGFCLREKRDLLRLLSARERLTRAKLSNSSKTPLPNLPAQPCS